MTANIRPKNLFHEIPIVRVRPKNSQCVCGEELKVLKTRPERIVVTLEIGKFYAHETILYCNCCKRIYSSEELKKLVPNQGNFGFDVIVYIGKAFFLRCRNEKETRHELIEKNVIISRREIGYLGKKFIVYLALAHKESQKKIRQLMYSHGGYILHLDGTCEGDSPHLMSALDEITDIVINNIKLPSENSDQIIPFLKQIKKAYGDPIATVHDMGKGILTSIEEVFPGIPDFLCHWHFLADIGNDLFKYENSIIRTSVKEYKIRSILRKNARALKKTINEDTELMRCLSIYLKTDQLNKSKVELTPIITVYIIIVWVLEANCELNGFGFPFDRFYLVFYQRLTIAYTAIKDLENRITRSKAYSQLIHTLDKIINDQGLQRTVIKMQEKVRVFDRLRVAMRVALPERKKGLNDDRDENTDMQTIKERVTQFRQSAELKQLALTDMAYKKMLKQIDKYWEKLFADPIQVNTLTGIITIQPQRTNNIMERFFRDIKKTERRKTGTSSLTKALKTMLPDTPLVKNLENPEYMKIILNGKSSLAERFAEIDIELFRQELKEKQNQQQIILPGMKRLLKKPNLPSELVKSTMK